MCSQPIVHDAQLLFVTPRASTTSSAASSVAPSKVADWKLRVGRGLMALKVNRFARVPSSRYFAVAGPKDFARRFFAAASTPAGSAGATFVVARTATALMFLDPRTAPRPPRPACRPSWDTV